MDLLVISFMFYTFFLKKFSSTLRESFVCVCFVLFLPFPPTEYQNWDRQAFSFVFLNNRFILIDPYADVITQFFVGVPP